VFKRIISLLVASLVFSLMMPVSKANSLINVGIWLINGRTSEIYGRQDGIADSQSQIQWVTCFESLSGPKLFPKRDNLSYTYTVSGPSGVVDSGNYAPSCIDSMGSCSGKMAAINIALHII
jgi:hypothetical protein